MSQFGYLIEETEDGEVEHPIRRDEIDGWVIDEDDYLVIALLQDPVYCAELLGEDVNNNEYGGMYVVRDYQYPLFRMGDEDNYAGAACARKVGKTESIKWRAVSHFFRRFKENLLITAPELIHLQPLTDAIETIIRGIRLMAACLDMRGGKTGFTHRPFGVDFVDGTKIVGRIPRLTGTGVKGQHQPDLMVDEAQDYPEKGWTEVHETVSKDRDDFTYHFYGVHSGARGTGFANRVNEGGFKILNITALQRPDWNKAQKKAAKAAYGGTGAPDYRRNILGEAGAAASAFFVMARLMACLDQDSESEYNTRQYLYQRITAEEFAVAGMELAEMLDLPAGYGRVWGGMDVGLTNHPTVIMLFAECRHGNVKRMKLIRRIHLERMRPRHIREALYTIDRFYGEALKGFGIDSTGLGLPIFQDMEDDENAPAHLLSIARGYFFNSKQPVFVAREHVTKDQAGNLRDQYGAAVEERIDPNTNAPYYVTFMPMIESSTRYVRKWVDETYLLLPFDQEITADMQGETQQRVKRVAGMKSKPDAFHILDAMRACAQAYNAEVIEAELEEPEWEPVIDRFA